MLKDLGLMPLVGDGMIGVVSPERHLRRWTGGRLPLPTNDDTMTRGRAGAF